ncbi:MAG: YcjX family protein, partial [Alphaproteobacteria bacterium]|nr:YcjX family protein [Alphaproteobacteria bacterium]
EDRRWPEGTRYISQLRLTLEFTPRGFLARRLGRNHLHLDIVDYPGEWLLDLPLMHMTYAQWSAATVEASRFLPRLALAAPWHQHLASLDATAIADEAVAIRAAELFTTYLARCRADDVSLSALPPGRFLMPGDFAGSPLLAFAPLDIAADATIAPGSLAALMERRYRAYVARIVKPFFFSQFARLDRQIVLVDVLAPLNAGATAVGDLGQALAQVLACFRQGGNSPLSRLLGRRIDRVLFAATKADLLHHESHDRLEAILDLLLAEAAGRAEQAGAIVATIALSTIRATREAKVRQKGAELDCIAGVPEKNEMIAGTRFDGETEAAIFPGDLPKEPRLALDGSLEGHLKFVRFRPPPREGEAFPHIRLDRALDFLLGDRLS